MKITELKLVTHDLPATRNFYLSRLQFRMEDALDKLVLKAGYTTLIFSEDKKESAVYHFAFNIPCNKIDEAASWCEQRGLRLLPFPEDNRIIDFPNWNAKSIYFLDQSGNIVEFIARFDLNNQSQLAFDAIQIACVSEIGVVTHDVISWCERIKASYEVPYYEKQPPASNFSVMGDAEGLFIVVPENRNWFPTNITSKRPPVEVTFEQGGRQYRLDSGGD